MIVMRLTDVQLTVPSILMALLVDGIEVTRVWQESIICYKFYLLLKE